MTFANLGHSEPELDFGFAPPVEALVDSKAGLYRSDFLEFTKAQKRGYVVNWHHKDLAGGLQAVQAGIIKRLLVMMPPRFGKSEQVSRSFPAWCLGKDPDERIISASHTATLAESMSRSVQNIMAKRVYLDTFDTRLRSGIGDGLANKKRIKETDRMFEVANGDGFYLAVGVGGGVTGEGGSLILVDDPVKDALQAESKTWRDRVWQWYTETLLDRGEGSLISDTDEGDERIVVCATPWHEDDLTGRILKHAKATGEEWVVIRFPAIYEPLEAASKSLYVASPEWCRDPRKPGESLWPAKRSVAKLREVERRSARGWNSKWQCRPSPDTGNMFKRSFWQWYRDPSEIPKGIRTIAFSLDAAFKDNPTSSRVVLGKWAIIGNNHYLLEGWAGHMGIVKTMALCRQHFAGESAPSTKLIEDKANGTAVIEMLQDEFHGIVPIEPRGGKVARAVASIPIIEGGNVYLPDWLPFAHAMVDECAAFPYGEHDDMPDMVSQLLQHYHFNPVSWLQGMVGRVA